MNKSELKKRAIESLSASGSLFQEGKYKQALEVASQAWADYFELQKLRNNDEDFTDLIYAARMQYEKCQQALADKPNKDSEYAEILQLKSQGEAGNSEAALRAADWFTNEENWEYLFDKESSGSRYLNNASTLYNSVINNPDAPMWHRTFAAYRLGLMFLLPKFSNVDMQNAFRCFKWAADNLIGLESRPDELLLQVLGHTVETSMFLGDVQTAIRYAQTSMDNGADMGIFYYIAYYGLIHGQATAPALIDAMIKADTWEGLLLKGIDTLRHFIDSQADEKKTELNELIEKMSIYFDKHNDTEGGNACMAFCIYKLFIEAEDPVGFMEDELFDYLREGVRKGNLWCYNYYGQICDLVAGICQNEEKSKILRDEAHKYLCLGANLGNREALKYYYNFLVNNNGAPELIEQYRKFAIQYNIKIES